MDRPGDSQKPSKGEAQPRAKTAPSGAKAGYLVAYNIVSALLWSTVLGRVVLILALHGYQAVFLGAGEFTKWTQTLAALEVLHAAIGTTFSYNLHNDPPAK